MSASAGNKIRMARLARVHRRRAELLAELAELEAEEASVFTDLADGESVDLRTGRRVARRHEAALPEFSDTDRAAARAALRGNAARRRLGS